MTSNHIYPMKKGVKMGILLSGQKFPLKCIVKEDLLGEIQLS